MDEVEFLQTRRRLAQMARREPRLAREFQALDDLLARTDLAALYHRATPRATGRQKYLDIPRHFHRQLLNARALGLHQQPPGAVLDIGAGGGFFCFAAGLYGHEVVAVQPHETNSAAEAVFSSLLDFHGVRCSAQRVEAHRPLARDDVLVEGARFDLITSFAIMFDVVPVKKGDPIHWEPKDYLFLLDDLRNFLTPRGRVALHFQKALFGRPDRSATAAETARHLAIGEVLRPFMVDYDTRHGLDGRIITLDLSRLDLSALGAAAPDR